MSYGNAPLDPYYNRTDRPSAGGGGGVAGVSSVAAGNGISIAPPAGTGNVTITNLRNNLNELEDVRAANPTADQVLQYDSITGFWEAKTLTTPPPPDQHLGGQLQGVGDPPPSVQPSSLLDVFIPPATTSLLQRGNYLAWDPSAGGPRDNPAEGTKGGWNPQLPRLSNNVDVALTANPPPTGHVLQFTGTNWVNATAPLATHSLNDHLDVSHTATGGEMLHFSNVSSQWEHTPRLTIDGQNNDNITVGLLPSGTLTMRTDTTNILSTNTGGNIQLGQGSRELRADGSDVIITATADCSATAQGITLTSGANSINLISIDDGISLQPSANAPAHLVRIEGLKTPEFYADDVIADTAGNGVPNMVALRREITTNTDNKLTKGGDTDGATLRFGTTDQQSVEVIANNGVVIHTERNFGSGRQDLYVGETSGSLYMNPGFISMQTSGGHIQMETLGNFPVRFKLSSQPLSLLRLDSTNKNATTYATQIEADGDKNLVPNIQWVEDEITRMAPNISNKATIGGDSYSYPYVLGNTATDSFPDAVRIVQGSRTLLSGSGFGTTLGNATSTTNISGTAVSIGAQTNDATISCEAPTGSVRLQLASASTAPIVFGVGSGSTSVLEHTTNTKSAATYSSQVVQDHHIPNRHFVVNAIADAITNAPVPALDDLTNVDAPTPSDNEVLTFNTASGNWIAQPVAAPTGVVRWGLGGNAEGVFPGQDAIIDNSTGRLVLAQGGVEFLQARTSWNIVLGDVANFDAQSPPNFPVSFYGSGIRSVGLGDTTFDVLADYGTIAFSHTNMANSTPISFNVGNGAGAVLQYNVIGAGRDDATTMAAKIEAIGGNAIPNMECITRAIAALPPPPTVPTVLNDLTDVETVNPNNQFLWFNSTTSLWEGSPRITVDPSVNENVRINMVGSGTFQLDDAIAGNLLSSVVGGAITVGSATRDVVIDALESTHTSQGNATFTAGGSFGLTSGNVVNITTGTTNASDLILQLGKSAATYATDCSGVDNAIPNVRYIDQAIAGLSSVYVVNGNNGGGVNVSTGGTQNINFSCTGTQQQIIMTPSVNPSSYVQIGTAFKSPEDYRDHVLALGTGDRDSAVPNVALVDSRIGTVAPASHTHPQSEVDGLVSDLLFLNNTKATKGGDTTAPTFGVYALGTTDNSSEVQLIRNTTPVIRSTTTNFVAGTNTLPSIYQGDSVQILSNNEAIELTSLAKDVSVVVGNASTSLAKISTTYKTTAGYASQVRAFADGSCIPNRQFVDEATDRHRCGGAFQGNTDPTTISVAGNVAAINGAITSYVSGFTVSGNTFFQYNGADTAVFFVNYTATPAITSVDRTAVFTCWLSPSGPVNPTGSPILGSRSRVITRGALTHTGTASASFYVSMTTGSSLRFYVSNTDAANDIIVEDFSMTALRVSQLLV